MYQKSTKNLLKVVFCAIFMAIPFISLGAFFDDDFDSYDVGDFYGNGTWTVNTSSQIYISSTDYYSFPNSLRFPQVSSTPDYRLVEKDRGSNVFDETFFFLYKVESFSGSDQMYITAYDDDNDVCWNIRLRDTQGDDDFEAEIQGNSGYRTISQDLPVPSTWQSIQIQWISTPEMRYRLNSGLWSDWETTTEGDCNGVSRIVLVDNKDPSLDIRFDSFVQETSYGVCGYSPSQCIYCSNQTDCENMGCYWLEMLYFNNCIYYPPPLETETTTYDFTTYYGSNSDFATPTTFINRLATATQPFLLNISSWLETYTDLFDLTQAQEKGTEAGETIPKLRGYLVFFNTIFSDLPISEILFIYFIVLIAIIIFRIIRQIKKLLVV